MRILVLQTAFIGDVALTTPFLARLRELHPGARIDVVATPQGCELLDGLENARCVPLDKKELGRVKGMRKVLSELGPKTEYELVFAVHRSLRSLALARKVRSRRKIAFRSFWSKMFRFETVPYPAYSDDTHYADKPLALLSVVEGG